MTSPATNAQGPPIFMEDALLQASNEEAYFMSTQFAQPSSAYVRDNGARQDYGLRSEGSRRRVHQDNRDSNPELDQQFAPSLGIHAPTEGFRPPRRVSDDELNTLARKPLARGPSTRRVSSVGPNKEFDWNEGNDDAVSDDEADVDDDSQNRSRRFGLVHDFIRSFPFWLRCLLYALLGDIIVFGILGVPDFVFSLQFRDDKNNILPLLSWRSPKLNIGSMPLAILAIYICMSLSLHYATLLAVSVVPNIIMRMTKLAAGGSKLETRVAEYLNYWRVLRRKITLMIWLILSNVLWTAWVRAPAWDWKADFPNQDTAWFTIIGQIWLTLFILQAMWTLEKLLLEMITTSFHRRAYKDRIRNSRFANFALERLSISLTNPRPRLNQKSPTTTAAIFPLVPEKMMTPPQKTHSRNSSEASKHRLGADFGKARRFLAQKASKTVNNVVSQVTLVTKEINNVLLDPKALSNASSIPKSTSQAVSLSRALFYALVQPGSEELYYEDFEPYFATSSEAKKAFSLFDCNGDKDISKNEFRSLIVELAQEKIDIEHSMQDITSAVASLNWGLAVVFLFVAIMIILPVWQFTPSTMLSATAAVLLPGTFIFGGTLKEVFESIIFLFVQHFYDVGDVIAIKGDFFTVRSMSILQTVLEKSDGRLMYAPNSALSKLNIDNVRRSGRMSENVVFLLDIDTVEDKLDALRDMMVEFLESESKDYGNKFNIVIKELLIAEKAMKCSVVIDHKHNWQEMSKRGARRNKFMFYLRKAIRDLKIECPVEAAAALAS